MAYERSGYSDIGLAPTVPSWPQHAWMALTRPLAGTYRALADAPTAAAETWLALLVSALAAGAVLALRPASPDEAALSGIRLLRGVAVFAALAVLVWAVFSFWAHAIARLLGGVGTLRGLHSLFALFSSPLMFLSALVASTPQTGLVCVALYAYWLLLYGLAVHATHRLPAIRSVIVVVAAVLLTAASLAVAAVLFVA